MESTKAYFKVRNTKGHIKGPSVMEAYKILFPDEVYDEKHRGGDDAMHEAKMLLEMVKRKKESKILTK